MKEFMQKEWCITDKYLILTTTFLTGLILGFLFSPIKKGIYCGNNNGNTQYLPKEEPKAQ